ncbi:hypothetical protein, partial [Bacillus cereus]|uniref:hypothetical protein n=1 Tax=Bacillus cereus TaxID=1396 RepID=UPI001C4C17B0
YSVSVSMFNYNNKGGKINDTNILDTESATNLAVFLLHSVSNLTFIPCLKAMGFLVQEGL